VRQLLNLHRVIASLLRAAPVLAFLLVTAAHGADEGPGKSWQSPILADPKFAADEFTSTLVGVKDLLEEVEGQRARGRMPIYIDTVTRDFGNYKYKAVFRRKPAAVLDFKLPVALLDFEFINAHNDFVGQGFVLYSRFPSIDRQQRTRFTGVWIKSSVPPEKLVFAP
jgi:hypothetical protein